MPLRVILFPGLEAEWKEGVAGDLASYKSTYDRELGENWFDKIRYELVEEVGPNAIVNAIYEGETEITQGVHMVKRDGIWHVDVFRLLRFGR